MFLTISFLLVYYASSKLVSVQVITRHGARNPLIVIPNYHNEGTLGELTTTGLSQHKKLGGFLRKHYIEEEQLFSENFNSSEIYIRSSGYNRCLMSAWAHLAGLFNAESDEDLDGLRVYPIKAEWSNEELLLRSFEVCPGSLDNYMKYNTSDDYKDLEKSLQPTFKELSGILGLTVTMSNMEHVLDAMFVEDQKYSISDQEKRLGMRMIEAMSELRRHTFEVNSTKWITATNGMLFFEMFKQNVKDDLTMLDDPPPSPPTGRRYRLYSAHDTTLHSVMHTLNLKESHASSQRSNPSALHNSTFNEDIDFKNRYPYYAAAFITELHVPDTGDVEYQKKNAYFKFYYQRDEEKARSGDLWEDFIPDCCPSADCPVKTFQNRWDEVFVDVSYYPGTMYSSLDPDPKITPISGEDFRSTYEEHRKLVCKMDEPYAPNPYVTFTGVSAKTLYTLIAIFSILCVAVLILIIFVLWAIYKKKKSDEDSYQSLD